MLTCHTRVQSIQLEGDAIVLTADAVICGSGAGGGVAAALLAESGAKAGPLLILLAHQVSLFFSSVLYSPQSSRAL